MKTPKTAFEAHKDRQGEGHLQGRKPVKSKMTVAEQLNAAADYIEEHGWCQNAYEDDNGGVCASGALREVGRQAFGPGGVGMFSVPYRLALTVVGRKLPAMLCDWNDEPGRTKEEVVAMFREAAKQAEKEDQ